MHSTNRNPSPDTTSPNAELEAPRPAYPFAHQRLDVHRVALDMARCSRELPDRVPRGYRSFADQLLRAAGQTVLLIGEGANRYTAGQKRQRYTEARGESGAALVTATRSLRHVEQRTRPPLARHGPW